MKEIKVVAFPKSGQTWLIHLLCDMLNCPQIGPEWTSPKYWNDYIHLDNYGVSKNHRLNITDGSFVIFTMRDPRDQIISKWFFSGGNGDMNILEGTLNETCKAYESFHRDILEEKQDHVDIFTRYEWLIQNPIRELKVISSLLDVSIDTTQLESVIERQSIGQGSTMRKNIDPISPTFMRKGIVGDWKNYFNQHLAKKLDSILGGFMLDYGYIDNRDWWTEVKK